MLKSPQLSAFFRYTTIAFGILFLFLTFIFYTRSDLATTIWPWSYTTLSPLSYSFIASVAFAIALSSLWIGFNGELGGILGGALNLVIVFFGSAVFMLQSYGITNREKVLVSAVVCAVVCVAALGLCFIAPRFSFKNTTPTPRLLRLSYALFAIILTIAGAALALKQPVFPWRLSGEAAIIYGWIFLGASTFFWYGVLRPVWGNAYPQLVAFIAYDVILLPVFLAHLGTVEPEYQVSLYIYVAVLVYSGALAIWYLLLAPQTRLLPVRMAN